MGWMSWERFRCNVDCYKDPDNCLSEKLFMRMADHLADDGYRDAGYVYLVIDDCWSERQRTNDGYLMADLERFPRGLNFLSDYIHSKGLKFGMYTNYGHSTCMGFPGTEDHDMEKDAERFAAWKIDYLKVDGCHTTAKQQSKGYTRFSEYLNKTNRPIVYSCSWPYYDLFLNKVEDKDVSVWLRPITPVVDGMHSYAIAIINHNTSYSAQVWLPLDQLGLNYTKGYQFRNVIAMQDLGTYFPHNRHEAGVQSTGVVLLKAVPNRG
ncbi:hypothetical protein HPB51_007712 [Rhipicephalus microplus]|uniref:Alpha-galactosidase n=1 Tax=Rhipicephalus microplus TaxID=6941 RepID=A0A9J6DU16_RHIMP|nr:hypothetical protein HPB51_007712 [Rhipicephalus microplus]